MILLSHAPEQRRTYYGDPALAALRALDEVRLNTTGRPLAGRDFIAAAEGCSIVVGDSKATAASEVFEGLPALVAYVHGHVDTRGIDIAAASRRGILVTRSSQSFGPAVSELALGFMIDLSRGITVSSMTWRGGGAPETVASSQLRGRTLGIVGLGHIGRALAGVSRALGMRVLAYDPYAAFDHDLGAEPAGFDELLANADFVVLLAAVTSETLNLIDARALPRMKPTAFLINVSRGELVDEAALENALDRKLIAGAALDVGSGPFQTPPSRLAARADVLATPHIGGLTREAVLEQALETVRQVASILRGEMSSGALNGDQAVRFTTPHA